MSRENQDNPEFIQVINQEELRLFLNKQKSTSFLQSQAWADFQVHSGQNIHRYGLRINNQLILASTFIEKKLPLSKVYFYSPKGPVTNSLVNTSSLNFFFEEIKKIHPNVIFIRTEPVSINNNPTTPVKKTIDIQPSKTIILDLKKNEDDLLKKMHHKTRYNIRLATRKGVVVEKSKAKDFNQFWGLMKETSVRDGFRLHKKEYYEKMINFLKERKDLQIKVFSCFYKNEMIATGLFSFSGDTVTYIHGASSNKFRNLMAPYLLQWSVIKHAKSKGFKFYDFYGIDEVKWPGVTRFKRGFSGTEVEYPGTFDIIFNKFWYNTYNLIRSIRRK